MNSSEKLHRYKTDLTNFMAKYNKGYPPIHFPVRTDYGISRPEEVFVAERLEKMFPKPDPKLAPPPPPFIVRELADEDLMPFGKHLNKPMSQVPPAYFNFLWKKGMRSDMRSSVADYIRRNLEKLKKRFKSTDW